MENALVDTKTGEIVEQKNGFTPEQVQLLKNTVAKGATNDELALFMHICRKTGLDPFAKQIYAIKRRQGTQEVMTFQVAIDGYRAIAEKSGNYAPGKEPTFVYDEEKKLVSATAYINKKVGDKWFEVAATAHYAEFVPQWWDGKESKWKTPQMWEKMPHVMLAKCAETQVLRRAFPNELSGTYSNEEMEQAETPITPKSVQMPKALPLTPTTTLTGVEAPVSQV